MSQPLTRRQRTLLDYVAQRIREGGCAPTLEEIARHFGLTAVATVHKHLQALERKGWITRRFGHARSIALVPATDRCPTCGQTVPTEPTAEGSR